MWIEVHQSLINHRKTLALADALGIKPVQVVGHMVSLWTWAIDNAPRNGAVTVMSPKSIAHVTHWDGDAQVFFDKLVQVGFLDCVENEVFIHNWERYIGRLIDRRESNADRQRRFRERKSATKPHNNNVTVTERVTSPSRNGVTVPNLTVPNHIYIPSSVADANAGAKAKTPKERKPKSLPDPRVKVAFDELVALWGYTPQNVPAETKAIKTILQRGFTSEQIVGCYQWLKAQPFWESKFVGAHQIGNQVGEFIKPRAAPSANGNGAHPAREETTHERWLRENT